MAKHGLSRTAGFCYRTNNTMLPLIAILLMAVAATASEKWSDPKLSVTNGLEIWLDATTEKAARSALKYPGISPNQPLDKWHDSSGNRRHLNQRVSKSRPRYKETAGTASISFDGTDDFLSAYNLNSGFTNCTIILFTAP